MPGRRWRFRPDIECKAGRYRGRLNVTGFGAQSIHELTTGFGTAREATEELVRRLRHVFQNGDEIEVRGVVFRDLAGAEAALLASLHPLV